MRFGPTPVAEAVGAVLAHSMKFPGGAFKKGRRLSARDVEVLNVAGAATVIVAQLETDDVPEDEAADALARAIVGAGAEDGGSLEIGRPFTGRVNLFTAVPGLLVIDADAIGAINRIDESITVATIQSHALVKAGQMVATVKIVPYAAPGALLSQACAAAQVSGRAIAIAPLKAGKVAVIHTTAPNLKHSTIDKTSEITRRRVEEVGGEIGWEARIPHRTKDVATAIARAADHDLILIVGASAIADRRDIVPAAVERAGGTVERLGMPVDPGNLLMLGFVPDGMRSVPTLGLPGCARSPRLNGFDWVLRRIAAGIPVGSREIAGMGVGGLLDEIVTRPQPRSGPNPRRGAAKIAAIILAAGRSERMGPTNKLLCDLHGKSILRHVADAAHDSRADDTIVVLGHQADRVAVALAGLEARLVRAEDYAKGLSASLKAGVSTAREFGADAALVCLGDMPFVSTVVMDRLIDAFHRDSGTLAWIPTHRGRRGNPVLIGAGLFDRIATLTGDRGASPILHAHADAVCEIETEDPGVLRDLDTPNALAIALKDAS